MRRLSTRGERCARSSDSPRSPQLGLFVSMLLPWYSQTSTLVEHNRREGAVRSASARFRPSPSSRPPSCSSAPACSRCCSRAPSSATSNCPGGDGLTVMVAGGWTALLIFYRLLDKPGLRGNQRFTSTVGVEWGIFIALLLALGLTYAGSRMRGAEREASRARRRGESPPPAQGPIPLARARAAPATRMSPCSPPRPRGARPERHVAPAGATPERSARPRADGTAGEPPSPRARRSRSRRSRSRAARPRYPPAPGGQMSFEDPPGQRLSRPRRARGSRSLAGRAGLSLR